MPFEYYTADGNIICEVTSSTDLGVIMSSDARFKEQIVRVAARARQQADWILRVFDTRDTNVHLFSHYWNIAVSYGSRSP